MKHLLFIACLVAALPASAQLINPGFEDTTETASATSASVIRGGWFMDYFAYDVTTDSHNGSYALSVWNWYYYASGKILNSEYFGLGGPMSIASLGAPSTQKPAQLSGWYKYVYGENGGFEEDSALVMVLAKRWNAGTNHRDTVAFGRLALPKAATYTPFTLNLADLAPGVDPDSVAIGFWSCNRYEGGHCNCDGSSNGECLYLTVDDLALNSATGLMPIPGLPERVRIHPNPASTAVTVDLSGLTAPATVVLYDGMGRAVARREGGVGAVVLERGALGAGVYFLKVWSEGKLVTKQAVVLE